MKSLSFAAASVLAFSLAACSGNSAPTITAFTLTAGAKDAAGNQALDGKVTATDADEGDRIARFSVSASGPAAVPEQSIQVPSGVTVTDLPIKLTLAAGAPKGEYTFVLKAYDDAGEPSAESTAKVTLQ